MSTTVSYKGETLVTLNDETKKLDTKGTWLEDDITITDTVSGNAVTIVDTPDSAGGTIRTITTVNETTLQAGRTIDARDLNEPQVTISPETGYDGFQSLIIDTREDLTYPKDVDFIDYDGRLVYSYTAQEFLALEEMPANPSNPGLVAQGWNWTLVDAKEYVAQWGALVIGQSYTTDNGETRFYITIPKIFVDRGRSVRFTPYRSNAVTYTINWGDGTTNTVNKTGTSAGEAYSPNHVYQNAGNYVVRINITKGELIFGHQGVNVSCFGDSFYDFYMLSNVRKIEIGNNVTKLGRQPFSRFRNLQSVSIPITCTGMDTTTDMYMFAECYALRGIVFPNGTVGREKALFSGATSANTTYISVPKTMTRFHIADNIRNLRKLTLPPQSPVGTTTLPVKLYSTGSITHLIIPGTYTAIQDNTMNYSYVKKLVIPETVTSFAGNATFSNNAYLEELHMNPTSPPSMGSTACLGGNSKMKIYVPYSEDHHILTAYQNATNWSAYASKMQEEPQS